MKKKKTQRKVFDEKTSKTIIPSLVNSVNYYQLSLFIELPQLIDDVPH